MKKKLALFDFDGTITRSDTMFAFIAFTKGKTSLLWSLLVLSPHLIGAKLSWSRAENAKKKLLSYHFKGVRRAQMELWAEKFYKHRLVMLFDDTALEKLNFHRSKGHEVYVVTASLDLWLDPWMKQQGLNCLCTRTKWVDDAFSGEFDTPNCQGPEKVRRIEEVLKKADYEKIYAYGDSKGDREMLAWADVAYYRRFV
jgi:HAD superfamily hydrolase (TIGR01490 family)